MSIQVLPTHLVNKIAAGEVIERPASIVKELLENALDAGATRIDVIVTDGGRKGITVSDNGVGMDAEDLALAFAPHATSKIAAEADLEDITTMGFRGEALASIASVSHAYIRSTARDADGRLAVEGYELDAYGAELGRVRPCAAVPGTTVTVRDLFFNTPARRKFLRTANTEFAHVSEQLTRLALPHPRVAFTLTHNGRTVTNLPAVDGTAQRLRDLFGDELADVLLPIVPRPGAVKVAGFLARPSAARASGKWQYFFLNGRYIRDRTLTHALREAYRGRLEPNRWPVAFVFLSLDGREVDVNVHPTKMEVRFRDGQRVYGELLAALRETLNRADLTTAASLERAAEPAGKDDKGDERRESIRAALADFFRSAGPPQPRLDFPTACPTPSPGRYEPTRRDGGAPAPTSAPPAGAPARHGRKGPAPAPAATTTTETEVYRPPAKQTIQVHDAYIISAVEDGLVIVDQHALHERLIYNDLRRRLAAGSLAGQRMLIPATVKLSAAEADALARRRALLERLGIEVAPFGPDTYAVQRFPSLLAGRGADAATFVRELAEKLAAEETLAEEQLLAEVLEMLACKAAVKAGQPLSAEEMQTLLDRRTEAEKASACPHGRPTTLKLSLAELEKQFKRT